MSQRATALLIGGGDVALEPLHREAIIAIISPDNQASPSSSEPTELLTGVSSVNNSSPIVDGDSESRPASPGQTSGTGHESHAEHWQCPLNFTQTIVALVALVLLAYLIKPQLADHALNMWSAAKDFRDDCRAQEAMNRSITWECKNALEKTLPPPPTKLFVRSFARHVGKALYMELSRTIPVAIGSVALALSVFFTALFCLTEIDPEQRLVEGGWLPVSDVPEEQYSSWVPNSLPRQEESTPMTTGTNTTADNLQRRAPLSWRRPIYRRHKFGTPIGEKSWRCCLCQEVWIWGLYAACINDEHRRCLQCTTIIIRNSRAFEEKEAAEPEELTPTPGSQQERLRPTTARDSANDKAAEDENTWLAVPRS